MKNNKMKNKEKIMRNKPLMRSNKMKKNKLIST